MNNIALEKNSAYFDTLDWSQIKTPRLWYEGQPIATHFFNGLSLAIPEAERFLVKSMSAYLTNDSDMPLLQDIKSFNRDENSHSLNHTKFNRDLQRHDYPVQLASKFTRIGFKFINFMFSKKAKLGITVGIEHITAVISIYGLKNETMVKGVSDIYDLFIWHAYDELEHRAAAFDVYQSIGGGYVFRVLTALYATFVFLVGVLSIQLSFILTDFIKCRRIKIKHLTYAMKFFFGRKGMVRGCLKNYLAIYKVKFHPNDLQE